METGSSRQRSSGRSVKKERGGRSRSRSSSCDSDAPSTKKRKKSSTKHKKVRSGSESRSSSRKKKNASERHKTKKRESMSKFSDEKKSRRSPSGSDDSESDDSGSSGVSSNDSEEEKRLKRKRKRRAEKDAKKKKKKSGKSAETGLKQVVTAQHSTPLAANGWTTADVKGTEGKQQRGPMTKESGKDNKVCVEEFTILILGHRLVKGDDEIIEEIVSKERQKAINKQATVGDGTSLSNKGLRKTLYNNVL
ncbi:ADP-ribosylation factor-like protein 6-interacting protein 4 [Geodia barretti]|uniref:ADP-ribosylation factor-like protein 6-interacting protein 4 n=2 Tax=Geodia barretti TaxID=519541 RepID=A0AA35QYD1_GEOBA|nr:ADP-ribosylation factor-like protein 6-interacting protein 4 [Geodia barretti]